MKTFADLVAEESANNTHNELLGSLTTEQHAAYRAAFNERRLAGNPTDTADRIEMLRAVRGQADPTPEADDIDTAAARIAAS